MRGQFADPVDAGVGDAVGVLPVGQAQDDDLARMPVHEPDRGRPAVRSDDQVAHPRAGNPPIRRLLGPVIDGHPAHEAPAGALPERPTALAAGLFRAQEDALADEARSIP
ncbi:hypothetical protein C5E08_07805 [Rathayibacter iranicus]|uniref:Uncharacterized protein n=1 Tax=Rathayibacter iranicus TaxID=59737 RepID=A0AAD1EM72_9MICO|nr:hypothetical protein [Rathayibacter iranicus]AZZ55797.1 hypothetical protein C7V51_07840 [Rathayibacter iranicus]MWV30777.1 hypothetical protein [Rathayibacter iranicus NCPPB 2253 = VKM Ac-1602]PPI47565.1 hypothetical protein C5E09_06875 [Rathayibacter iranicus]PPI60410.1 hypothetical protein C5E08_07805 [Rathayibacter iranicus]PPI72193.1 hypothetical protein C5E01_06850 [Rathayibacter iranicus]